MWMWAVCVGDWDEMGFHPEIVIGLLVSMLAMNVGMTIHSYFCYSSPIAGGKTCTNVFGATFIVCIFLGGCTIF